MKRALLQAALAVLSFALLRMPAAGDNVGHCFVAESGKGIIYNYAANGTRTVYATNVGRPYGLAFDGAGNLFVADFNGSIYKITPKGSNSVFATPYNGPAGLAIDSSSNLFVGIYGNDYIYKYAPDGSRTIFGQIPDYGYGNGRPVGLAFNSAGVLYASDQLDGYLFRGVPNSPFAASPGAWGLAFDSRNNLFAADSSGGKIYKFASVGGAPGSSHTTFASGMSEPAGIAFDSAGNLFVADYLAGKVYKYDTNGVQSTFATGLLAPAAVAFLPAPIPPSLAVSHAGNTVVISWPATANFTLQQNTNLAAATGWSANTSWTASNGTNYLNIVNPSGRMFFRLSYP